MKQQPKQIYYYQIPDGDKRWEECLPIEMEFSTREDAVNAAYLLSLSRDRQVIRFTDNPYYKSNSGAYIQAK